MKAVKVLMFASAMAGLAAVAPALAQGWNEIGHREVSHLVERDMIEVAAGSRVRALRLCVDRNPIRIYDMTVRFTDNSTQAFRLRQLLPAGDCSRVIGLRGRGLDVASVGFTYETASLRRERAHVRLYGR